MQIAIVGLAGAGKTTVFNTLTRGHAETGGYGALQLNVGVVKVPDARLDKLAEVFKPKKIVHADVTYVDLPAPPASSEGRVGTEELPAEHLARLREADALIHVVRAWDDAAHPHPAGSVDAARDLEQLDLEFMLADLAMIDRRLERLHAGGGRHGTPAEREANEREEVILVRLKAVLEGDRPIRDEPLDADDEKAIRGFRFLTQKPVLVLAQRGRGGPRAAPGAGRGGSAAATGTSTRWSTRCPPRSRWSWASSSPTRRRCSWRSWGWPSRASTASSPCPTGSSA